MKVKLLRDSRIQHKAGEILEVSPAEADFLLSVNSAVPVDDTAGASTELATEEKTTRKRSVKK